MREKANRMPGAAFRTLGAALVVLTTALILTLPLVPDAWSATNVKLLHSFDANGTDGYQSKANLVFDRAGNLFGTTFSGGAYGAGTIFQLTRGADDTWTETVLHSFGKGLDGANPDAGVIFDAAGNLYGTTHSGGNPTCYGCGIVFQLAKGINGTWTESVLYAFCSVQYCTDGANPNGGLTFDTAGNLYGTTEYGGSGARSQGTVFQLAHQTNGTWAETVVHDFGKRGDGDNPYASLTFDAAGNLYGTTVLGGIHHYGTVFQLTPGASGMWSEIVLHSFGKREGNRGMRPYANLIFDAKGNLYGTTVTGGHGYSCGTVFRLTPGTDGKWKQKVLHSFNIANGCYPYAGLVFDAVGNLYGTASIGNKYHGGVVFQLAPGSNDKWTETVLHRFRSSNSHRAHDNDGYSPVGGLVFDTAGSLYGTNRYGGAYYGGTVFEIKP